MADLSDYLTQAAFRNDTNLRPAGMQIGYTQEMLDELVKCKSDPLHFISSYVHVVDLDRGVVPMELREYQKRMINAYHDHRRSIVLTPRQYGKTITAAAYLLWYAIFNDDKTTAILANKQATADEILHRIRLAYSHLPKWMQQGVVVFNKRSIELENGSRVFCAATSSSGVRGKSINCVVGSTIITVRNKKSGEILKLPIGELAFMINNKNTSIGENSETTDNTEIRFL